MTRSVVLDSTNQHMRLPPQPYLIDDLSEISSLQIPVIAWILIIEKEARLPPASQPASLMGIQSTFRTLASSALHRTCRVGKGIILTVIAPSSK